MNTIKALRFRLSALDEYGLDCSESFEAEVPGACQADYAKFLNLPDYKYSDNYKLYEFMEDKYFVYSAVLPEKNADKRTFLHLGGVDYKYEVFVDDEKIYAYEGMFKPCDVELTDLDFGNKTLKVLIFPVPKRADAKYGRWQADNVAKPPVSYGWDWHPRLIPSGIWKEAYIEEKDKSFIGEFKPVYKLSEDYKTAEVFPGAVFEGKGEYRLELSLRGETVFSAVGRTDEIAPFTIQNPELWWPHCYGEQTMYDLSLEFSGDDGSSDKVEKSIGFRRSRLVTQDSNWYIDSFPFTQAKPPITLEINGKQIFAKGSNWVNPEIFFGKITRETYEPLLTLVKRANMNLLRVWGGSIVNKDSFFELCDRLGIMVWQEFPLACNCYRDDDHYLDVMRSESTAIIEQVRTHPSLVMWCGGNELYTGGSSMTEQFKVLRLLNSQCYLLDENTPFIMTSPIFGMRHGHYAFKYSNGEECFAGFQRTDATAFTEFGSPGASDYEYLSEFLDKSELSLDNMGEGWIAHHGLKAWESDSWLNRKIVESYFGKSKDLRDLIKKSQILQRVGYKAMFEEGRRKKPDCSMTLNWCLNEPWPTAANNSLINYPAKPKDCFEYVAKSLAPVVLSARVPKFSFREGELLCAELYLLNDLYEKIDKATVKAYIRFNGDRIKLFEYTFENVEENRNSVGPVVRYILPHYVKSGIFKLILECEEHPEWSNEYELMYYNNETINQLQASVEEPFDFVGISKSIGCFDKMEI